MENTSEPAVAAEHELPALLSPPKSEAPMRRAPVPPPSPATISSWEPGQRAAWLSRLPTPAFSDVVSALGIPDDVTRYVLEGGDAVPSLEDPSGAQIGDWRRRPWLDVVLGLGPASVARLLRVHSKHWRATPEALAAFVARFDLEAITAIPYFSADLLDQAMPALLPLADVGLAEIIARRWTQTGIGGRNETAAVNWLVKHPSHATWALMAAALDDNAGRSRAACTALRWLSERGARGAIEETARSFGVDAAPLLDKPPTERVRPPPFWQVGRAPPPILRNGKRLPDEAVERLVELLLTAPAEHVIDEVRTACTEESLRDFALGVFTAFLKGSYRDRTGRAVTGLWPEALVAFGGEEAVSVLVGSLRESRVERDGAIIDAICMSLAAIGTDRAIVELGRLASRPRRQIEPAHIQDGAERALERLAIARGLTPAALAEKYFPDIRKRPSLEELLPFSLTSEEVTATAIVRFEGRKLATSRPLPAGWRLGPAGPNGIIGHFERPLPTGQIAVLEHSGIDIGDAPPRIIKLRALTVRDATGPVALGDVDPVLVRELIRDVSALAAEASRVRSKSRMSE